MFDIQSISEDLTQADDGIWYTRAEEAISYPSQGNGNCFEVEDHSFWFSHRNNCITTMINAFAPDATRPLFDIGGGNGFVARGIQQAGKSVVLVEPGRNGATNAKSRGLNHVICSTLGGAGFKASSLPAVGLFDVIEHIEQDLEFLKQVHNFMQPGGILFATVPSYQLLWSLEDEAAGHFRRYSNQEICETLRAAGFSILFASSIFRFLPIPIFLLRAVPFRLGLQRKIPDVESVSRDHAVKSGNLNKFLSWWMQAEIKNLENKRPMSFGGSCLVVAECKK